MIGVVYLAIAVVMAVCLNGCAHDPTQCNAAGVCIREARPDEVAPYTVDITDRQPKRWDW